MCDTLPPMNQLPVMEKAPWLLQTKLYPPRLRENRILRRRLSDWLAETAVSQPLTLLSAPAGYGKTTLLTTLTETLLNVPLAWLSLDEEDDELNGFLFALIGALQTLNTSFGQVAQEHLPLSLGQLDDHRDRLDIRRFMGVFINDLLRTFSAPFIFVLDDLHILSNPNIFLALDYLLEHLPAQLHLVFASRRDPPLALPRLRARQQLAECRLTDLRFTDEEAIQFLNESLKLALSTQEVATLQLRTEGWAAGMTLLANSLEQIPDSGQRADFITHLANTHQHVFDYLSEEVLSQQPADIQQFLMEIAVMQQLTAVKCQIVTQRPDAGEILERLYKSNLFLMELEKVELNQPTTTKIYYFHTLFADFLRHRLIRTMPNLLPTLHQRAATVASSPFRGIHHYIEAGAWADAVTVIVQVGEQFIRQGRLDAIIGWIQMLPEEYPEKYPQLAYFLGLCALQKGDLLAADHNLSQAQQGYEVAADPKGQGAVLATLGSVAFLQLDYERSLALANQALTYPLAPSMEVQARMTRASLGLFFEADFTQPTQDFETSLQLVYESEDPEALLALTLFLGREFAVLPNGLSRLEPFCQYVQERTSNPISPIRLGVDDVMAFVYLRRGRIEQAIATGKQAINLKEQLSGYPFLGMNAATTVSMAYAAQGDYETADFYLQQMLAQVDQLALNQFTATGGFYPLARMRWLEGKLDELAEIYERMCILSELPEMPHAPVLRLLVRGFLQCGHRDYEAAEKSLQQALALDEEIHLAAIFASPRFFLAYLYWRWQRPLLACTHFEQLLNACQVEDTPGLILQEGVLAVPLLRLAIAYDFMPAYAQTLLDKMDTAVLVQAPQNPSSQFDLLTQREQEVLHLLADGASNKTISETLTISLPTVKSHVSHILSKLDVRSRGEAVAKARAQNLI